MMIRKIIKIDEKTCNGCGLCIEACHEGAIELVGGAAKLVRDDYCDGLGDCLPSCPTGAISFEEREALSYNENEARKNAAERKSIKRGADAPKNTETTCGCPGVSAKAMTREGAEARARSGVQSQLMQWPCQIKLVPVNAPYFDNANLLIAADCAAYAYGNFHSEFMRNSITLIGCPKLDCGDYAEKLAEIILRNNVKSIKTVRMEVPCCSGIENAVNRAVAISGKSIPRQVITVSTEGKILL